MAKKNLTVSEIKKQDKKTYGEQIEVEINGYSLKIDKVFRKTKINSLIAEVVEKFEYARQNEFKLVDIFVPYSLLLILKYFTSLSIPDKLEDQLKVMEILIDNNYLEPITEALPQDEINAVFEAMGKIGENINSYLDNMFAAKIENEDILK